MSVEELTVKPRPPEAILEFSPRTAQAAFLSSPGHAPLDMKKLEASCFRVSGSGSPVLRASRLKVEC